MFYEDDLYHPNQGNDYDVPDVFDELRNSDKHYHRIYRNIVNRDGLAKRTKVEMFSSKIGGLIRDAVTGEYTKYKVGSKDEDLFFKTSFPGLFPTEKGPFLFYYKSPDEFERQQDLELESTIKEKWLYKCQDRNFKVKYES